MGRVVTFIAGLCLYRIADHLADHFGVFTSWGYWLVATPLGALALALMWTAHRVRFSVAESH